MCFEFLVILSQVLVITFCCDRRFSPEGIQFPLNIVLASVRFYISKVNPAFIPLYFFRVGEDSNFISMCFSNLIQVWLPSNLVSFLFVPCTLGWTLVFCRDLLFMWFSLCPFWLSQKLKWVLIVSCWDMLLQTILSPSMWHFVN